MKESRFSIRNSYTWIIVIYTIQLILLSILVNNNLMQRYDFFQSTDNSILELNLGVIILFLNVMSVFVFRRLYYGNKLAYRYEVLSLKQEHMVTQINQHRQHQHDLKNHLLVIQGLADKRSYQELNEYLEGYIDNMSSNTLDIVTGIDELDILVNGKLLDAQNKNIDVDYICSTKLICRKREVVKLISIVGNLLDNAIYEAGVIENKTKKIVIRIDDNPIEYIFRIGNNLHNKINIDLESILQEGFSTKEGDNRGNGLPIVKNLVERIGGDMELQIKDEMFEATIRIPKHSLS